MNEIMVSVVCDVFNHEDYLRECLDGIVMQQTNFAFEILVHDDASTDKSVEIIQEYVEKYPHLFKPIYQKENQYSRGVGIWCDIQFPRAKGKYIAICEGDDYWIDPLKLQKQVDFMEANPEYGLCYTDYSICDSEGNIIEESHYMNGSDKPILTFEEHLFRQGYIAPMTWLYRKDVYESITNNMLKGVSDGSYVVALEFFYNSKVAFLPINTATYRVSPGSASRPLSLSGLFKYRKGVYDIEKEYIRRYINNEWYLSFVTQQEIYELYPIAVELHNQEYLDWCNKMALKYPMIDLWVPRSIALLKKEAQTARSSRAYRLGKFILAPFKKIKQLLKL